MERNPRWEGEHAGGKRRWRPTGGFTRPRPIDLDVPGYRLGVRLDDFGEIFEGHHPRLPGPFVIKLFGHLTGSKSAAVVAFSREAGQISSLRHPHIAQVFDSGTLTNGTPFVAMERLQGWTLEEHLAFRGRLPLSRLLPLLRGVVSALSAAHRAGIVHSEIRPDNVFLTGVSDNEPGLVKLLDFGVSRLTWAQGPGGRGISADDARYLAPEQVESDLANVDPRTDQFAVAALICRVMHGTALLSRNPVTTRSDRVANPDLRRVTPLTHRASAFKGVLLRALSERPRDRYRSVAAFLQDLEASLAGSLSITAATSVEDFDPWARQNDVKGRGKPAKRLIRKGPLPRARDRKALAVMMMIALLGIGSFAAWGSAWWSPVVQRLHGSVGNTRRGAELRSTGLSADDVLANSTRRAASRAGSSR